MSAEAGGPPGGPDREQRTCTMYGCLIFCSSRRSVLVCSMSFFFVSTSFRITFIANVSPVSCKPDPRATLFRALLQMQRTIARQDRGGGKGHLVLHQHHLAEVSLAKHCSGAKAGASASRRAQGRSIRAIGYRQPGWPGGGRGRRTGDNIEVKQADTVIAPNGLEPL